MKMIVLAKPDGRVFFRKTEEAFKAKGPAYTSWIYALGNTPNWNVYWEEA